MGNISKSHVAFLVVTRYYLIKVVHSTHFFLFSLLMNAIALSDVLIKYLYMV